MNTTAISSQLSFDDTTEQRAGIEARNRALAAVEANADDHTKALVDQAILAVIEEYGEAGLNQCRDLLPHIPNRGLFGQRMRSLALRKVIVWVRDEPSTLPSTHAKRIGVYRKARPC